MISKTTFIVMIKNQRALDQKIAEKMGITDLRLDRVKLAYKIEVCECINELKGLIKYWSVKEANREAFIEEFVDALHFVLSYTYRYADKKHSRFMYQENESRIEYMYRSLMDELEAVRDWDNRIPVDPHDPDYITERALQAVDDTSIYRSFSSLILIAEWMGFVEKDILDAYYKKLQINHGRSDSGTY